MSTWSEELSRKSNTQDTYLRTVAAAVVDTVQAPPAMIFLHALHFQIPTAVLFTESCIPRKTVNILGLRPIKGNYTLPQNVHVYLACWDISIFLICLRREAP